MTFRYPIMVLVAVAVGLALAAAYSALRRGQTRRLAALGVAGPGVAGPGVAGPGHGRWWRIRRHLPAVLFVLAITLLLVSGGRPRATVRIPQATGTIILAFDVSTSMTAPDVEPSRLAAAQSAATRFVRGQPSSVEVGVVAFAQGALTTKTPTSDHDEALAAIERLHASGATSLGQAILASLSAIVGQTVALTDSDDTRSADLGYWNSATIVVFSDGEDTGGPDAVSAAELAATAGVRVETIGFGTTDGTTIQIDGYQVDTALNEELLTQIAQSTAGSYHRAGDGESLDAIYQSLDLRITARPQEMELTGAMTLVALALLTIGGLLMVTWFGRIL